MSTQFLEHVSRFFGPMQWSSRLSGADRRLLKDFLRTLDGVEDADALAAEMENLDTVETLYVAIARHGGTAPEASSKKLLRPNKLAAAAALNDSLNTSVDDELRGLITQANALSAKPATKTASRTDRAAAEAPVTTPVQPRQLSAASQAAAAAAAAAATAQAESYQAVQQELLMERMEHGRTKQQLAEVRDSVAAWTEECQRMHREREAAQLAVDEERMQSAALVASMRPTWAQAIVRAAVLAGLGAAVMYAVQQFQKSNASE